MKVISHKRPKHHFSTISPDIATFIEQMHKQQPIQIFLNQISKDIHRYEITQKIHDAIINKTISMHNIFVLVAYYKCFNFKIKNPISKLYLIKHLMEINATGNQTQLNCIIIELIRTQNKWFKQSYLSPYINFYQAKKVEEKKLNCLPVLIYATRANHGVLLVSWIQQLINEVYLQIKAYQIKDEITQNKKYKLYEQLQIGSLLQLISIVNFRVKHCKQLITIILELFAQILVVQTASEIGEIICNYEFLDFDNQDCQQFIKEMLQAHHIKKYKQLSTVLKNCWKNNEKYPYVQFIRESKLLNCIIDKIINHKNHNLLSALQKILVIEYQKHYREKFYQIQFYLLKNQLLHYILENIDKIQVGFAVVALMIIENPPIMSCFNIIICENNISKSLIKTVKIHSAQCKDMLLYMLAYEIKIRYFYMFNKMKNKFLNDLLNNNFGIWLGYIESVANNTRKIQKVRWTTLYMAIAQLNFEIMKPPDQELTQYLAKILALFDEWQKHYANCSKYQISKYGLKYTDLWKTKQTIRNELENLLHAES